MLSVVADRSAFLLRSSSSSSSESFYDFVVSLDSNFERGDITDPSSLTITDHDQSHNIDDPPSPPSVLRGVVLHNKVALTSRHHHHHHCGGGGGGG